MAARRQVNEHKSSQHQDRAQEKMKQNIGKTTISKIDKENLKSDDFTSYEEIE